MWGAEPEHVDRVAVSDGALLTVERYGRRGATTPALVFVHGIGAYAGPYRHFARRLADHGALIYLPHLRGHGDSPGTRGQLGTPARVFEDVEAVIDFVRAENPGCELVLGGESMGALITLAVAARVQPQPDRLLFLAPALRLGWGQIARAGLDPSTRPIGLTKGLPAHGSIPGEVARVPSFRQMCLTDPKMVQRLGMRYLLTIGAIMVAWEWRYPSRLPQPTLVIQGDADRLLNISGAAALVNRLPAGELRLVEGAWHNLLWDPTSGETIQAAADWLLAPRS